MPRPTLNQADFPLCSSALSEWRAANDPDDKLGVTLSLFVPRGHTTEAMVSYRSAMDGPAEASKSASPIYGVDDAALAAALKHFLAFHLPKYVLGLQS